MSLRLSTVVAASVLALGTAAQADSPPAATATPAPSPTPTAKLHGSSFRAALSHLPIIDIVPVFTEPGAITTAAQTKNYDYLDVGGTVQIPITNRLSYSFDRIVGGIFDQASGRVLIKGVPTYPGLTRDSILVNRLDYQAGHLTIEGGSQFRHRIDGATGVSTAAYPYTVSSSEAHDMYLGLTYTTSPIRALGGSKFLFNITGEGQQVDHHVGVQTGNTVTYIDENPHQNIDYETTQTVGWLLPIGGRNGITFSAKDTWGAINYYENAPFPYRYSNSIVVGITKKFSDLFSLTMNAQNSDYIAQGYPFPAPNAIHTEMIDVLGDFHFNLNTLMHGRH